MTFSEQAPESVPWSLWSVYCFVPAIVSCHNVTPSSDTGDNGHNTPELYGRALHSSLLTVLLLFSPKGFLKDISFHYYLSIQ